MKTLIIYASKTGTTEKCANIIKNNNSNTDIFDVKSFKNNINEYENIIILSPVYIGQLNKSIKRIMLDNINELLSKNLLIGICSMNQSESTNVIENNINKDLIAHAKIHFLGGAYNFEKLSFINRFIVKNIAKINESVDNINYSLLKTLAIKDEKGN